MKRTFNFDSVDKAKLFLKKVSQKSFEINHDAVIKIFNDGLTISAFLTTHDLGNTVGILDF